MIFLSENKHKLFEYSKSFSDPCYKKGFAVILFGDFFFFFCLFLCLFNFVLEVSLFIFAQAAAD